MCVRSKTLVALVTPCAEQEVAFSHQFFYTNTATRKEALLKLLTVAKEVIRMDMESSLVQTSELKDFLQTHGARKSGSAAELRTRYLERKVAMMPLTPQRLAKKRGHISIE